MLQRAVRVVGVAVALASTAGGCGSTPTRVDLHGEERDAATTSGPSPSVVCDGSEALRLVVAYDGQLGRQHPYSGVLYELGAPFLYVNGHCQYWCNSWNGEDRLQQWRPMHTGVLSTTQVAALTQAIRYDRVAALQHDCASDQFADSPLVTISDGVTTVLCATPTKELKAALTEMYSVGHQLYEAGGDEVHGVRIEVGAESFPDTRVPPRAWPITRPPTEFVVPPKMQFEAGLSSLLTDPASVDALRRLRTDFITEQESVVQTEPGIPIEGFYILYVRDDVPWTNAMGLPPWGAER